MRHLIRVLLAIFTGGFFTIVSAEAEEKTLPMAEPHLETATFAGGCFWSVEHLFDDMPGVVSATSGYTGGHQKDPNYHQVSSGETGHAEAVQVVFDPAKISFPALLNAFWTNIDPTTPDRQFCDEGPQYRSAIFYHDDEQKRLAEESKQTLVQSGRFTRPIVTVIAPAVEFYPAEDYHQDYVKKNPVRYGFYRKGCRRDQALEKLWGKKETNSGGSDEQHP